MTRLLFPVLLIALLAISFAPAQTDQKIDVNLASVSELQKLPGITAELARKMVSERPYSKAADLGRAGLSTAQIQQIAPLIKVTAIQPEKPGPQGGWVASVPVERLNQCADSSSSSGPMRITLKTTGKSAAICIPRTWFVQDGESITYTGRTEISSLVERLNKSTGKQVKVVELDPTSSTLDRAKLLAGELKDRGAHDVEVIPAKASGLVGKGIISGLSKTKHDSYDATFVDLNKTASEVDTLLLVVPSEK